MTAEVIIKKQRLKVRATDEQQALRMRQLLNEDLQSELESMFERVFEHSNSSEIYINIDKLSIDLGIISESDFKQALMNLIEPKLIGELENKLQAYMESQSDQHSVPLELNSIADQQFKALLTFLETGNFPWWFSRVENRSPGNIINALSDEGIEKLLLNIIRFQASRTAKTTESVIERLFMHIDSSSYEAIIQRLVGLLNNGRLKVNAEAILKNREAIRATLSLDEEKVYRHLFTSLIKDHNRTADNFMVDYFQGIISEEKVTELSGSEKKEATTAEAVEPVYIGNAGLLLLHPFLETLFSDDGLLDPVSRQFISERAKQEAAVSLYYLQSGKSDYKEWEMPLNKILCGIQYQDVIPGDIVLTDREKQNCDELLTAVVSHWSALKGAGIEALRNTFVLRAGKLSSKDSNWLIQVERTGVDILLDRLPWGYSTIKLSWLDRLIIAEW